MDCEHLVATTRRNLALVNILNLVDSRYVDPNEGVQLVEMPPNSPKYEIIDINQIGEAEQLVPMNPGSEATEKR